MIHVSSKFWKVINFYPFVSFKLVGRNVQWVKNDEKRIPSAAIEYAPLYWWRPEVCLTGGLGLPWTTTWGLCEQGSSSEGICPLYDFIVTLLYNSS